MAKTYRFQVDPDDARDLKQIADKLGITEEEAFRVGLRLMAEYAKQQKDEE